MNKLNSKKIFIILFAVLYFAVALVSTLHAIAFFGLANVSALAILLAVTFEIGQAAVLFSILTDNGGRRKVLPWILMCVLTLVQILGNVYSSYKFLILNSTELLRFFREPIFVWTELPDTACNVILTYIVGAILPIVSLCMTAMVTNYIGDDKEKPSSEPEKIDNIVNQKEEEILPEEPEPTIEEVFEPDIPIEEKPKKTSRFVNI